MKKNIIQEVFDELVTCVPIEWKELFFFAGYTDGSYTMKYIVKTGDDSYLDCYNIPGLSKTQVIRLFMKLDKKFSVQREELDNNMWTVMSLVVDKAGHMKVEYEYNDHSENMIEYETAWESNIIKK